MLPELQVSLWYPYANNNTIVFPVFTFHCIDFIPDVLHQECNNKLEITAVTVLEKTVAMLSCITKGAATATKISVRQMITFPP